MLHLLHPVFVHVSAAFLVLGSMSEAFGILSRRERVEWLGAMLVLAGTVSLVPTLATGFLAENVLDIPDGAKSLLSSHERTGLWILAVFLATQLWKAWYQGRVPEKQRFLYVMMLLCGAALVSYGAFLGGEMVYAKGVGVMVD